MDGIQQVQYYLYNADGCYLRMDHLSCCTAGYYKMVANACASFVSASRRCFLLHLPYPHGLHALPLQRHYRFNEFVRSQHSGTITGYFIHHRYQHFCWYCHPFVDWKTNVDLLKKKVSFDEKRHQLFINFQCNVFIHGRRIVKLVYKGQSFFIFKHVA